MAENQNPQVVQDQALLQQQLDTPKAALNIFELPCGYLAPDGQLHTDVVLREMTGREEDLLAAKKTPAVKKMNELFSRCIERLGSLTEKSQIAAAVPELLLGDRVFLMFAIRRVTLGDEYPFRDKCPSCEKENLYIVDLGEMKTQKMPNPTKRVYEGTLPSGKTVRWRPLCGRDEAKMAEIGGDDQLSIGMLMRLEMLDNKPPTLAGVKDLSSRDRNAMRALFDEQDGGLDTEIDMSCPKCYTDFKRDIDVGQASFFFPSVTQKASKKKSSI